MNLRAHLDADAFSKLSALATKPTPREKVPVVKKFTPRVIKPSADEKRRLAKTKARIERHERGKQANKVRSVVPETSESTSAKVKANRSRKMVSTTAEARKINGMPLPANTVPASRKSALAANPMPKQASHKEAPQDLRPQVATKQAMKTMHKKYRKPDAKIRLEVAESQLELSESELLALCDELSIEPLSKDGLEYLTGADFEKLRYHFPVKGLEPKLATSPTFEARLRQTYGADDWAAEGTPLERYEAKEAHRSKEHHPAKEKADADRVPYVKIVSGGLPTLGRGHK
ncbi:hypothetical protein [Glutamicibacter sp.]|uniref:hypothetical protein n=1 Tax=Glutamicibacter sp. TaxID=1931995 RepID=UPI002B47BE43|nr:hypothetical protein [Glutamicibacter sp.]HJX79002.1 hypothetical protein [Glutamicibacter sp.]